jgi:hypothetical protein
MNTFMDVCMKYLCLGLKQETCNADNLLMEGEIQDYKQRWKADLPLTISLPFLII